jgi:hypothetical protein
MNRRRLAGLTAVLAVVSVGATDCDPPRSPAGNTDRSAPVVVYVEDHTGAAWPVTAATREWDAGLAASVRYGRCRATAVCVRVHQVGELPDDSTVGVTRDRVVRMNGLYADVLSARLRLAAVCHELGHALGLLRHNEDPDSCMHAVIDDGRVATQPGRRDLADLNRDGVG